MGPTKKKAIILVLIKNYGLYGTTLDHVLVANTEPNPRPRSSPESVRKATVPILEQTADLTGIRQIGMAANLARFDAADW